MGVVLEDPNLWPLNRRAHGEQALEFGHLEYLSFSEQYAEWDKESTARGLWTLQ